MEKLNQNNVKLEKEVNDEIKNEIKLEPVDNGSNEIKTDNNFFNFKADVAHKKEEKTFHAKEETVISKATVKVMSKLRSSDTLDPNNVICILPKAASVEVLEKGKRFCKVKYLMHVGYVMSDLLIM